MGTTEFRAIEPVLMVEDIERTRQYYCDLLGFTEVHSWADDDQRVQYLDLAWRDAHVHIQGPGHPLRADIPWPEPGARGAGVVLTAEVDDVDESYLQIKEKGVKMRAPPETYPWGARAFLLEDPDGYVWRFTQYRMELE